MRRKFGFLNSLGEKNIFLAEVALLLVMLVAVGSTISWIEEVSQVDFDNTKGQQTPSKIGKQNNILKSDMITREKNAGNNEDAEINTISLSDYFSKSGDMHLSPCYSDGEKFYFPKEGVSGQYRAGTKDDANVNYLSATFRITSQKATSSYWFEKSDSVPFISFKKGTDDVNNSQLEQFLRCSITIDGSTNVYALNSNGDFYTVSGVSDNSPDLGTGRSIDQYTYYNEDFNNNSPEGYYKNSDNVTNKPNQGAENNLNGNTLFSVAQPAAKTVTVKIWLEANNYVSNVLDVASININFVSSWAKSRRVYVKDATVHQSGFDSAKWLGTDSAKLYWGIKNDLANNYWPLTKISGTDYYYVDIPAVYNNVDAVFFRCSDSGWNNGNKKYTGGNTNIMCWNYWETTFPDTFHSEVYTVYSTDFATWESAEKVHCIYFINSQKFGIQFETVKDYMWDSASVYNASDINGKVVKNGDWPGLTMTTKMAADTGSSNQSLEVYAFFYNSDYDRIIFNNGDLVAGKNQEFQTQDLSLTDSQIGKTFDMSTLTWFSTSPGASDWGNGSGKDLPTYSADNTYLFGNFVTNNQWRKYRFAYGGEFGSTNNDGFNNTNSGNRLSKVYIKSAGDYEFIVYYNGNCYKTHKDDVNLYAGRTITLRRENTTYDDKYYDKNMFAKSLTKGIYRFYISNLSNDSITVSLAEGEAHNN